MLNNTNTRKFNIVVLHRINEKYGVGLRYIRMCLDGDRKSELAEAICKEYKILCAEVDKALKSTKAN